jgi:hypothetical protein
MATDTRVLHPDPRPDFYGGDKKTLFGQGMQLAKENAGAVAAKVGATAVRAVSKAGGVVADILLNPTEVGAGSDKIPDIEVRQTPSGAIERKEFPR